MAVSDSSDLRASDLRRSAAAIGTRVHCWRMEQWCAGERRSTSLISVVYNEAIRLQVSGLCRSAAASIMRADSVRTGRWCAGEGSRFMRTIQKPMVKRLRLQASDLRRLAAAIGTRVDCARTVRRCAGGGDYDGEASPPAGEPFRVE